MCIYWREQRVAVEIVGLDDEPFDREKHPDTTVLSITPEEIMDPEAFSAFARTLARHFDDVEEPEDDAALLTKQALLRRQLLDGMPW